MITSLLCLIVLVATPEPSASASQPARSTQSLWGWTKATVDAVARRCGELKIQGAPAGQPLTVAASGASAGQPQNTLANLSTGLVAAFLVGLVPLSLAMLTSYIRISVVLALLRTGLAAPGVPPVSVQTGLAILLTAVVMTPTIERVWNGSVQPVLSGKAEVTTAAPGAIEPVRAFMIRQVDATGQHDKVRLFTDRAHLPPPTNWAEVPTSALVPGYCLAELHTAFQIGVRLLVPFLVLDLVVAAVLVSLGLFLVPPTLVSLPLKLLLFVAADGWALVVGNLLKGFVE